MEILSGDNLTSFVKRSLRSMLSGNISKAEFQQDMRKAAHHFEGQGPVSENIGKIIGNDVLRLWRHFFGELDSRIPQQREIADLLMADDARDIGVRGEARKLCFALFQAPPQEANSKKEFRERLGRLIKGVKGQQGPFQEIREALAFSLLDCIWQLTDAVDTRIWEGFARWRAGYRKAMKK